MWPFQKKTSRLQRHVDEARRKHESSDLSRRRQLIDEANRQMAEAQDQPIVSLENFFVGNQDVGSIGANLTPPLDPQVFYERLKIIRARSDVHDVLVEIRETMKNDSDPFMWPFSDQIYILTNASGEELTEWLAPLQPDEVSSTCINKRVQAIELRSGVKPYRVWWD